MKRKLVKQGAATLMISLPAKWLKKFKLDKGDEIDLEERDNSLLLFPDIKDIKKETEINISKLTESSIRTIITNAYRLGYDKIKINFQDKRVISIIQDIVENNLIGFEIMKKSQNSCEIENITEPSFDQFENIFKKIFANIDELFEIAQNMLKGEKQEFEDTERKIQQFDNFCRRVISKNNLDKSQLRWTFHNELIHAQREIYHMLRYVSKNKIKENKETLELLRNCKEIYELIKKAYINKDIKILEDVHEIEKEYVYKEGYKLINKNPIIIHHILSSIRGFYLSNSPLLGLLI
jgi:phosphate uptake regulator